MQKFSLFLEMILFLIALSFCSKSSSDDEFECNGSSSDDKEVVENLVSFYCKSPDLAIVVLLEEDANNLCLKFWDAVYRKYIEGFGSIKLSSMTALGVPEPNMIEVF